MTCIACSSAIEKGLTVQYKDKGLDSLSVILLVHKLKITFFKHLAVSNNIKPEDIQNEVEDIGFGAQLLSTQEIELDNLSSRGNQEKADKIKEDTFIVKGMTCASCTGAIENYFGNNLPGIVRINVSLLTNKAIIKYDYEIIKPRKIIEEIEDLGFEAELQPNDGTIDIRDIVKKEVDKYKNKLVLCALLYIPMIILIWIVPYSPHYLKDFMSVLPIIRGSTFYILLCFLMASIMQFYMGYDFYISAYKSLKHKSANMDVLIVIGTTSAWFYGFILIFIGYSPELQ
jgi:Cu+-exporting ATPase